jgi:hypothetical protein
MASKLHQILSKSFALSSTSGTWKKWLGAKKQGGNP